MRFFAAIVAVIVISGCSGERAPSAASIGTAPRVSEIVAGPISQTELDSVISIMESLPADQRPSFQPALEQVSLEGLRAVEILAVIRRNYIAALEVEAQAENWRKWPHVERVCSENGISLQQLAVLLTRIGCAHHASESGTELDVAKARSEGETRIAELLPQIDTAQDEMKRRALVDTLSTLVAFDAYLTLLDLVPEANRKLVAKHRPALSAILPATPDMAILPQAVATETSSPGKPR